MEEIKYILKDHYPDIILDKEQIQIIKQSDTNMMVIAGAGSGKTTTMVAKVKYLVDYKSVDAKDILFISFTKDTIHELQEQLWEKFHIEADVMTFHKLALKIVRKAYYNLTVLTDVTSLIEKLVEEESVRNSHFRYQIKSLLKQFHFRSQRELIMKLEAFLNRKRINGIDIEEVMERRHNRLRTTLFMDVFMIIEKRYESYLLNHYLIDFYGMIIEAIELIKTNSVVLSYQYIIVDEYQDISMERFLFLEEIRKQTKAKLIVVGDDWQSIYAFSGSRVSLFHLFSKLIPDTKEYYLSNTYRNSQELIDIAGNFVMKDKAHLKKKLISSKHIEEPIRIISYSKTNFKKKFLQIISSLENKCQDLLILSRYQHDIYSLYGIKGIVICEDGKISSKQYPHLNIQFLTVHASKGLGYDNVIVLNMSNTKYGFPSKVDDDELMKLLDNDNNVQQEEERRLFYVAITRSKNYVYLMTPQFHVSSYIKEIKKELL